MLLHTYTNGLAPARPNILYPAPSLGTTSVSAVHASSITSFKPTRNIKLKCESLGNNLKTDQHRARFFAFSIEFQCILVIQNLNQILKKRQKRQIASIMIYAINFSLLLLIILLHSWIHASIMCTYFKHHSIVSDKAIHSDSG